MNALVGTFNKNEALLGLSPDTVKFREILLTAVPQEVCPGDGFSLVPAPALVIVGQGQGVSRGGYVGTLVHTPYNVSGGDRF